MYDIDDLDRLVELPNVPRPEVGAPCPVVFSKEGRLVLSYWVVDEPPYPPTTAPLGIVQFHGPHMHSFGPPNEDTIEGHPLSSRGLYPYRVFRVDRSSLVRRLERMYVDREDQDPKGSDPLNHYIFTFQDSTFECVALDLEAAIVQVGWDEEYSQMLRIFRSA